MIESKVAYGGSRSEIEKVLGFVRSLYLSVDPACGNKARFLSLTVELCREFCTAEREGGR